MGQKASRWIAGPGSHGSSHCSSFATPFRLMSWFRAAEAQASLLVQRPPWNTIRFQHFRTGRRLV
ncbi:hypothetical protein T03_3962 [Trichinella britovi]|uniref:Uncharacterized protein n=1 Tax=Trichinella britovi TaxID=45882 RepID=A0A0V1C466_TRIBR|nr:hypothetical protein T03_3962 [Trichinella britovi]